MASNWYLKDGEAESGPIPFRELVERARSEALLPGDLVRPEWNAEWQRADGVVGLFYMAQKSDAELETLDAPVESSPTTELLPAVEVAQEVPTEQQPGWMLRLLPLIRGAQPWIPKQAQPPKTSAGTAISTEKLTSEAAIEVARDSIAAESVAADSPSVGSGDQSAVAGNQVWSDTLNAALAHTDQRSAQGSSRSDLVRGSRFTRLRKTQFWLGCQLLVAMCIAGLVAERIQLISANETSRLEQRAHVLARQAASGARGRLRGEADLETQERALRQWYFPVLGQVEPNQYILMLAGICFATVVASYAAQRALDLFVNRWLESRWREAV